METSTRMTTYHYKGVNRLMENVKVRCYSEGWLFAYNQKNRMIRNKDTLDFRPFYSKDTRLHIDVYLNGEEFEITTMQGMKKFATKMGWI